MPSRIRMIASKLVKTRAIWKDQSMRAYVPETKALSVQTLREMLNKYSMVYVKPVSGTCGNGVFRVELIRKGSTRTYRYQLQRTARTFPTLELMARSLLRNIGKRPYLVQRGIHLLKHQGRPFDIRVMVQRNPAKQWETTGIIARVASPGKIVTNYHNGGTPVRLEKVLAALKRPSQSANQARTLSRISLRAAAALSRTYPAMDSVGADIGLDRQLHPWILELNTRPDPYIFKHLHDSKTYGKILRYARALGRIKSRPRTGKR